MGNYRPIKNINFSNLKRSNIMFRDFSGRPSRYNKNGARSFCVRIDDPQLAQELNEEGWNIKILAPRDEDQEPSHYLNVAVAYTNYPPHIYIHSGPTTTELNEDTVSLLDDADIISVDLVVRPYQYERDDGTMGIKAYAKYMHVTVEQDPYAAKYAGEESPEDDVPWR